MVGTSDSGREPSGKDPDDTPGTVSLPAARPARCQASASAFRRIGRRQVVPRARGIGEPFRRHDRRADDACVVAQRGRDDRRPRRQARDVPVGVLADAATEDEQCRPHQVLDALQVLVEVHRPGLPGQASAHPGGRRGSPLRRPAADLHLAEFGVRDERAVDEHAGPDTRSECQEDHDTALAGADAEAHLGDARRVGVVDDADRPLERLRELVRDRVVDPGRVDVGRGHEPPTHRRRPAGRRRPARLQRGRLASPGVGRGARSRHSPGRASTGWASGCAVAPRGAHRCRCPRPRP